MVLEYLGKIPRKVIYAIILILMVIPLLTPLNLPIAISDPTQVVFDDIRALEGTGQRVLFIHDHRPLHWGEFKHLYHSVLQHLFLLEDVRFVSAPIGEFSPGLFYQALDIVINPLNKEYGVDWVQLPWLIGGRGSNPLRAIASDWTGTYATDEKGTPVEDIPILRDINSLDDFEIIIWCEMGAQMPQLAQQVYPLYPDKTYFAVIGADTYFFLAPYLGEGNVYKSALVSTSAAAEYQQLFGGPYSGAGAILDSLSLYHLLTVILVILANVAYQTARLRKTGVT